MITDPYAITPVEEHEGILLKREDLFQPFGENTVNGGKLRQCYFLVEQASRSYDGVISCCSVFSPQAPITAATAKHFGMRCTILYGGTNEQRLQKYRMPAVCRHYGADLVIASKSGIHKILYYKAREIAKQEHLFVVDYGFNIADHSELLLDAVSSQAQNIPDIENLVITCGSGITTIGILLGLERFKKRVQNIYLVCTAPDRRKFINSTLQKYGCKADYRTIDLFHQKGFKYEEGTLQYIDGIKLHPNYEAKAYQWIKEANLQGRTLLWVVGSKPIR